MKWFGFHSVVIHNPVIPLGYLLFILSIHVFNGSVIIGSFWQFYFHDGRYSSVHTRQMNWKICKSFHVIRQEEARCYCLNKWFKEMNMNIWILLLLVSFKMYCLHNLSYTPDICYLFSENTVLTRGRQMWGGETGGKAGITVCMILGEISEKEEYYFHILKKWSHLGIFHRLKLLAS